MAVQTLINGESYSFSQIKLNILGANPVGVTAISYNDEETKENNYGLGRHPVSRGRGPIEYSASITMQLEEVKKLQEASPTGRIQDIPPFDIIVTYLPVGGVIKTDVIRNVEFTTNPVDASQGDTSIEVELELIVAGIDYNKK